jgi:hypothetical protein
VKQTLASIKPGQIAYTSERIGDDANSMEVREVFYIRDADPVVSWAGS